MTDQLAVIDKLVSELPNVQRNQASQESAIADLQRSLMTQHLELKDLTEQRNRLQGDLYGSIAMVTGLINSTRRDCDTELFRRYDIIRN